MITPRKYKFPLPHHITGIQDSFGVQKLQSAGMWDKLPAAVQRKLIAGEGWFSNGTDVTKADLDELPDDVWTYVANELGLEWEKVPPPPTTTSPQTQGKP